MPIDKPNNNKNSQMKKMKKKTTNKIRNVQGQWPSWLKFIMLD